MASSILDSISCPADLAGLDHRQLDTLAEELRAEMVASASINGGHLAPSLGAVEIIIALHRALSCPNDRIVFDVGHQAYAHKLLTGRRAGFASLRKQGGISGFPKITESEYDSHNSGHASDALSTALGYALARDMDNRQQVVAAVVGDASFTGGMSLEALNEIGHKGTSMVIILNDNGMSISRNVGGFAHHLAKARLSEKYVSLRDHVEDRVNARGRAGRLLMGAGNAVKESVKQLVMPGDKFFEGFGVTYIGPVDGHDIACLEEIIKDAVELGGPILIHAVTTKGKGYTPAEEHPDLFHGIGPFDVATGKPLGGKKAPTWTSVFSSELVSLAGQHNDIVAITAAMPSGTGLAAFSDKYPDRFLDVGIAEENAVGVASSLAMAGKVPFVAIYSTFMQRAYDQMMINVALQEQHVVFCLDRAGLVGEDGPTHHGAFDISFMRTIPGMSVLVPSSDEELRAALRCAYELEGPVSVRYPRGTAIQSGEGPAPEWELGKSRLVCDGSDVALLAVGTMVKQAQEAALILESRGISARVVDMRWAKPVDVDAVQSAASQCGLVVTIEENSVVGGFGSAVLESMAQSGCVSKVLCLGLPDGFVGQGNVSELLSQAGLDASGIAASVAQVLQR